MTSRAYGAHGARSPRSHYDVIFMMTSFATELATPTVTDVRTYQHLTAFIYRKITKTEPGKSTGSMADDENEAIDCVRVASIVKGKEKKRKSIYIALFGQGGTLKALRHGSHSFTCK